MLCARQSRKGALGKQVQGRIAARLQASTQVVSVLAHHEHRLSNSCNDRMAQCDRSVDFKNDMSSVFTSKLLSVAVKHMYGCPEKRTLA
jgi:hypothetical protein